MTIWVIFLFIIVVAGFGVLYLTLKKSLDTKNQDDQQIEDVVNKVFGMSVGKIASQSKQILEGEKQAINVNLENKQKVIERLVTGLQKDLADRQKEIRVLEQDRVKKFSEITTALSEHRDLTKDLKTSTEQLSKVLSNNQARGEWGERIIEDLLQSNGLIEGTHYLRQSKLGNTVLKPDITLLLPNKRVVAVDVKFPYQEIQKMSVAETKKARSDHLKQFSIDLKVKINKVAEYIKPKEDTLDYAIMFVPNEMVFSFINQQLPTLVDFALSKRVIIVSPFTFLIVARTVMESYRNFMIGDKLKDVVKYVDDFVGEWSKFKDEFEKFGRSIKTLQGGYEKITETRTKQMERKIDKIESYRQGSANLLEDKN
ncbi:MAG: DNA recombination protein RmuC [Candidatus Pacebacteria bacterium]|jgi:DNA recombination protein RmuC|nr:DNA recombination protein RmuC [Candidatus Paceibacterota bacterium]MBT4652233.1 DNA recombination protein RmuC [Candidatus Paceibacterota bacterium]MBT6756645.1 DNA recombination protein RmuC [Candidatus Paceibacterota bacterium]MBT6921439.1 DNA recombination protein RmuC [Candidatus Paceibacterota bacterium]